MEVTVEHLGAVQFEVRARQHTIISDQPEAGGGFDEGMTPPELMLASLGSCAAYYAAEYLRKKGLVSEGTRVHVTAGKARGPARLENFKIEVQIPVLIGDEHSKGVEEAIHRCLIHNTLLHRPTITIEVEGVEQTAQVA
ncbi:MAG TPA: OsmC family protein [Terriglobales bacterium]|jgi:putative redox protein|nr:OsmC family protein [Terriglobales bacterium]